MPVARLYLRVSKDDQTASIEAQKVQLLAYYEAVLKPKGYLLGPVYIDRAVSGKIPFGQRKAGLKCSVDLEPGDIFLCAKTDRAFRSTMDCLQQVDVWASRGVVVALLDCGVDTTTAAGRMLVGMISCFAEFERRRISERTKEGLAAIRAQGGWVGSRPYGFRIVRPRGGRSKLVPYPEERQIGAKIVQWHDEEGRSFDWIYLELTRHNNIRSYDGRGWSRGRIPKVYREEKRLQADGK